MLAQRASYGVIVKGWPKFARMRTTGPHNQASTLGCVLYVLTSREQMITHLGPKGFPAEPAIPEVMR